MEFHYFILFLSHTFNNSRAKIYSYSLYFFIITPYSYLLTFDFCFKLRSLGSFQVGFLPKSWTIIHKKGKNYTVKKSKSLFLNFEQCRCFQSDFLIWVNINLLFYAFFSTFYAPLNLFWKCNHSAKNIKFTFSKLVSDFSRQYKLVNVKHIWLIRRVEQSLKIGKFGGEVYRHWWRIVPALVAQSTGTGGAVYWHWWRSVPALMAVCKGATPSVEQ